MTYAFDFSDLQQYAGMIVHGIAITLGLTAVATFLGAVIGIGGAALQWKGGKAVRGAIATYVELIRNTPFIVQLFFIFFGLPGLGVQINEMEAALLAMTINLGAYAIEIVRAGIEAVSRGQYQAALAIGLTQRQAFRSVILPQALATVFPALACQVLIVMLGSAVVSQISVTDLTYAANYIQSRNFRSFEIYLVITVIYLVLAIVLRRLMNRMARGLFAGRQR
ncbi:amino acid ABC transporter membrane protein 1, PAAT family (TC 3.A.1.3.-) [Collimonas sp. OK307]|uniref:amino acid ABC transporter permease n=1 Tax=Collimonas sp. OK307 TaxID=1801620 RepID=UPI0008EA5C64|nr:amino acid ABC transporter permease [Collimonas sp. OK307]SFH79787.1 amino acid ABC transporter membrane protein 1, PAAT family (TC 3.A.1.3.-) [Collimonas sp. OK307]